MEGSTGSMRVTLGFALLVLGGAGAGMLILVGQPPFVPLLLAVAGIVCVARVLDARRVPDGVRHPAGAGRPGGTRPTP